MVKIEIKMDVNYSIKKCLEAIDKIKEHNEDWTAYQQDLTGYLVALQILTNLDTKDFFIPQLKDEDLNFNVYHWVDHKKVQEFIIKHKDDSRTVLRNDGMCLDEINKLLSNK